MDTASLSPVPVAAPVRNPAPPSTAGDGGFAALLDQQTESAAATGGKQAHRATPDKPGDGAKSTEAKASPAAEDTTAAGEAGTAMATAGEGDGATKGDRGERTIGEGAEEEVTDKVAGDAALTDPSALLTGMLLDLTAPTARKDQAPPPAAAPPAEAETPSGAGKLAGRGSAARLAAPVAPGQAEKAGDATPSATAKANSPATESAAKPAAADPTTAAVAAAPPPAPSAAAAAPAPVAAPRAVPVPLDPEALSVAIARRVDEGSHVFEISLTPDDLGRVDVHLEFAEDGQMTARVYADRPETLHLLQQDKAELVRNLAGQSTATQNATVSFALRDGTAGQGGNTGSNGSGEGGGGNRRGRGQSALAAESAAAATSPRQRRGGNALAVDIQV
ncbi:flagellar hook-length control protein FliK [Zavarzinia aquatilis]|uniref:Flagellar hook-length control protein-like C-terminal domain-containing protein n=1 Tax=Zavarzinia aquatilis TaxID=2211142 RepID=A0A317DWQ3_9PROT|nr:flagellar hook-length control protein FliK [Zavarzinia aquatilis]PWR18380.1 hypothetical protein DKG74_19190 [Zavarzinia aquatilis]